MHKLIDNQHLSIDNHISGMVPKNGTQFDWERQGIHIHKSLESINGVRKGIEFKIPLNGDFDVERDVKGDYEELRREIKSVLKKKDAQERAKGFARWLYSELERKNLLDYVEDSFKRVADFFGFEGPLEKAFNNIIAKDNIRFGSSPKGQHYLEVLEDGINVGQLTDYAIQYYRDNDTFDGLGQQGKISDDCVYTQSINIYDNTFMVISDVEFMIKLNDYKHFECSINYKQGRHFVEIRAKSSLQSGSFQIIIGNEVVAACAFNLKMGSLEMNRRQYVNLTKNPPLVENKNNKLPHLDIYNDTFEVISKKKFEVLSFGEDNYKFSVKRKDKNKYAVNVTRRSKTVHPGGMFQLSIDGNIVMTCSFSLIKGATGRTSRFINISVTPPTFVPYE